MSKKKLMVLALTAVMILSAAVSVFAAEPQLSFNGSCKKCFLSSEYISKSDSEKWSLFTVSLSELTGAQTGQARPETSSGDTCGSRFSVSTSKSTKFLPNDRGKTTNEIHVKLYTNEYADNGTSASTSVKFVGKMTGTK